MSLAGITAEDKATAIINSVRQTEFERGLGISKTLFAPLNDVLRGKTT
jgi:hypothetical protein